MNTPGLVRRLGLDRNPLRRRTDKIASCLAVLLLAVFAIGAPMLSVAAARWAGHASATEQRASRAWRQVPAVLLHATPALTAAAAAVSGSPLVLARWTAPDGRSRTGRIPASAGLAAGRTVRLWVDTAGLPTGPPLRSSALVANRILAAAVAPLALGIVLWWLAWAGRWALDRRRLADWEAAWAAVGPRWTKRFWSQGQP
jgi:hypothetical protein